MTRCPSLFRTLFQLPYPVIAAGIAASAALATTAFANEGGMHTGGGDVRSPETDSAWFLDSRRTIRVCIETSETFGVSPATAVATFEEAYKTWRNFLVYRRIAENSPAEWQLATQLQWVASCAQSHDLRLALGVSTPETEIYRAQYANPIAFAHRTSYNMATGWGAGVIWVSPSHSHQEGFPNWSAPNTLLGIFLHEIGHVLGNDHIPGTIMDERIAEIIERAASHPPSYARAYQEALALIEISRFLDMGSDSADAILFKGKVSSSFDDERDRQKITAAFNIFGRRSPSGTVDAEAILVEEETPGSKAGMTVILRDALGEIVIPLSFANEEAVSMGPSSGEMFRRARTPLGQEGNLRSKKNHSVTFFAFAKTPDGRELPVVIEINVVSQWPFASYTAEYGAVRITYFSDGGRHDLFVSKPEFTILR